MQRKIILFVAVLVLVTGAYFIFSKNDKPVAERDITDARNAVKEFVTTEDDSDGESLTTGNNIKFRPGERTLVKVYDKDARLRYAFKAEKWKPNGRDRFEAEQLEIQVHMPRGEIAYITADQADIGFKETNGSQAAPRNGELRGNVRVDIDRATRAFREANPDLKDRSTRPDDVIRMEMESARFDMDRSELFAEGSVVVDAREARIDEVSGLTVRWDQVDNRLESLRFNQGGRFTIRRGADMVEIKLPGAEIETVENTSNERAVAQAPATVKDDRIAVATNKPISIPKATSRNAVKAKPISAHEAAQQIRAQGLRVRTNQPISLADAKRKREEKTEVKPDDTAMVTANNTPPPMPTGPTDRNDLRSAEDLETDMDTMRAEVRSGVIQDATAALTAEELAAIDAKNVQSFKAVFEGSVDVEQMRGDTVVGKLLADQLEAHFDFGKKQERFVRGDSEKAPKEDEPEKAEQDKPAVEGAIVIKWDGPFELNPLAVDPAQQSGGRFDIIALGNPVRVNNDDGGAVCQQLVFRNERNQIWLTGEGKRDVQLKLGDRRELVAQEVFFDQRRGLGRIDGKGFIRDESDKEDASQLATAMGLGRSQVEIYWSQGVDLELGKRPVAKRNPSTGEWTTEEKPYLRRAWFHGDVRFRRDDEKARADEVAATFGYPTSDSALAEHIDHLDLAGNVVLANKSEIVQASHLDIEMTRTVDNRSIPQRIQGEGNVLAKQGRREVRANEIDVNVRELPSSNGNSKGAPALAIEKMFVKGNVEIRDPSRNMKVSRAETLRVQMNDANELALLQIQSPDPNTLARARFEDMAVHGHYIEMSMAEQRMQVPGRGAAWMITRQDFGGRPLEAPKPVKITWANEMQMKLNENYGVFVGDVAARMDGFDLDSDKLTIRFADAPPAPVKSKSDGRGVFAQLSDFINDEPDAIITDQVASTGTRKRPVYVVAEGNAQALMSTHAASTGPTPGRLLSRAHITGTQIAADLEREELSVPSAGTLLIEDYQFEQSSIRPSDRKVKGVGGPLMSSVRSDGPSQTLVTWEQKMDFFGEKAMVVFDRDVKMDHCSGQQIVKLDELLDSMNIDRSVRNRLRPGRKASLTCGNLLLEFVADNKPVRSDSSSPVRATDLRRMIAKGQVLLEDGDKSLMGDSLKYLKQSETVTITGGNGVDARIFVEKPGTSESMIWTGDSLTWDRRTNRIEAPNARVTSSQ